MYISKDFIFQSTLQVGVPTRPRVNPLQCIYQDLESWPPVWWESKCFIQFTWNNIGIDFEGLRESYATATNKHNLAMNLSIWKVIFQKKKRKAILSLLRIREKGRNNAKDINFFFSNFLTIMVIKLCNILTQQLWI